jgi:predicted HicB family RNase H-like nuclease
MPAKETDKQFLIRMTPELFERVKTLSKIEYQSINQLINLVLDERVKIDKRKIDKYLKTES